MLHREKTILPSLMYAAAPFPSPPVIFRPISSMASVAEGGAMCRTREQVPEKRPGLSSIVCLHLYITAPETPACASSTTVPCSAASSVTLRVMLSCSSSRYVPGASTMRWIVASSSSAISSRKSKAYREPGVNGGDGGDGGNDGDGGSNG